MEKLLVVTVGFIIGFVGYYLIADGFSQIVLAKVAY